MPIAPRLSRLTRRTTATVIAAAACLGGALGALPAAPALAKPIATSVFNYADMPDLDQQRAAGRDAAAVFHVGLPSSGFMYCGPAAGMDALAFLADHGASNMSPGSLNWTTPTNYETMSAKINELGGLMGTGAKTGTSLGGFQNGMLAWSANHGTSGHRFGLVSEFIGDGDDWQAPNLGMAAFAEAVGNPVIVSIGYYTPVVVEGNGREIIGLRRTGGHFVAMTGFDNNALNFMDPADAPAGFAQSAYANQVQPVTPVTTSYTDSTGKPYRTDMQPETLLRMPGYAGGSAYIEGYTVIQPTWTLTAKRNYLIFAKAATTVKFKTAIAGVATDVQVSPAGDSAYYAMTNSKTVYKLDLRTGVSTPITKASSAVTSLAVNTKGDTIYAAAGREVSAVSNTGAKVAKTTLDSNVAAIAYDPMRGQIDAVTPKSKAVQVLAPSLATQGTVSLPASALANASVVSATVDSTSGKLTIKAPGVASTVVSAPIPAPAPVPAPTPSTAAAITALPANTPVVTVPTTTALPSASSLASLATAPVVSVTPVVSPIAKAKLGSIVIGHSAATTRTLTSVTPAAIVRASRNVLSTGVLSQESAG